MSAKLPYTLSDENPGLHKQIGCMNGFFQIFDRHHFLNSRRVKCPKMLPPIPGQISNHGVEHSSASEKATETSVKKVAKEKQRVSTESSRTSFSSSSCSSSFSSLECNRITQLEPTTYGQNKFPENTSRECLMNQPNTSVRSKTQPLDLRDIVKDSVYREARALSVATVTKEEVQGHMFKHIDSPRPSQLPTSVKHRHSGLGESFQSAAMPRQATWNSKEERDRSRLLTTTDPPRDGSRLSNRDAPRFSFDGRESRDTFKSLRIKELPRLSLDSRASTVRATTSEMKSSYFVQDLHMENRNSCKTPNSQQELGSHKRSSSVVAKLMGLEAFPGDASTNENQTRMTKTCTEKVQSISRSLDENKNHKLRFQQNSHKDSISPRMRNADSVTKSTSSPKFPIEPAPWKQIDGRRGSQVSVHKHQEANTTSPNSPASVYGEIEKRLADIEFKKSGKDLRALKRILEAMHKAKEMSETGKDNQALNLASQTGHNSSPDQSFKLSNQRILQRSNSAVIKGNSSPRSSRSPIVIMKPGALIERGNNTDLLMTSTDSVSGDHKFQTSTDTRKGSFDRHPTKDPTQRGSAFRDPSSCSIHSMDINTRVRTSRSMQTLKVTRHVTGESTTSSGTVSPSLQQKKNGLQKQSCTRTTSPSDSSRTRRQLGRQPIESGSPGRKLKPKSANSQQNDNQFKKTGSNMSDLRNHGNAISQQSESSTSSASHIETDATSTNGSDQNNSTFFQYYSQKQKNLEVKFMIDRGVAEPALGTSEQPSPISVLDATFYRDESPSPVKKITNTFRDDGVLNSDEVEWAVDLNHQLQTKTLNLRSESDHNKSENIQHLVSSLGQDESIINYITVLCDDSNQDHRYISKILLASGLLRDLDSVTTSIPFHPSGNPINPKTFLAVERTMTSMALSDDDSMSRNTSHQKTVERTQRKLIFDVVNEILGHKLVSEGDSKQCFSSNKLAGGRLTGQQLLRELFLEIDQLQANKSSCSSEDEDDSLPSISWGDLMHQSTNWSSTGEISGLVLDIERLIFKDLISEIVNGETAGLQTRSGGYCRQLFSK